MFLKRTVSCIFTLSEPLITELDKCSFVSDVQRWLAITFLHFLLEFEGFSALSAHYATAPPSLKTGYRHAFDPLPDAPDII
jgi:hypothetical protein